ncbi:hypothetical protein [Bradyrhizobium sp.]|jgi:prolyl-tRNA editing enzyme YbaK/EbsC (Cys-tRNA(Pro) deacylase)|uniref:hypothetical protein n=1 Tax=Bradyrhizobium sp. TaxID=376 RepID=UPI003C15CD34
MGELLSFPGGAGMPGLGAATTAIEVAEKKFDSMTDTLEIALDLLDQMVAKIAQMDCLLSNETLKAHFEKRRREIVDEVDHVHSLVASLSNFSTGRLKSQK